MTASALPVLTPLEIRVLGVLVEKQHTTPDYYPLSLNALVAGCNQKSSRDPVMSVGEVLELALEPGLNSGSVEPTPPGDRALQTV